MANRLPTDAYRKEGKGKINSLQDVEQGPVIVREVLIALGAWHPRKCLFPL